MRKYYAVKIDRNTGNHELLETVEAKSLKEARVAIARKHTDIIADMLNTALAVVGRDGYKEHYMAKCEGGAKC